ncbi:MAG: hypothetical protein QHC40_10240 [Sphingobium sp.]|nr:hypothetical protein [Sphingobium sp.]
MMRGIRQSDGARGLLAVLALFVLVLQLVAPSGFMPVRTDKGVVVTLCTGQGAVNVVVHRDAAPGKPMPASDDRFMQHCAFAGGAAQPFLSPLPPLETLLPIWQGGFGVIAFAVKTGWIARLAAPPPPSSGPPATF